MVTLLLSKGRPTAPVVGTETGAAEEVVVPGVPPVGLSETDPEVTLSDDAPLRCPVK
jgi:hypothetical protein